MKVSFENPDKINGLMTLVVEEADYKNEVEKTLKDYRKKANVPGFRPGQAPMGMIKRQFGASVKMEAINKLVGQEIYKYVQDNNIQMLGELSHQRSRSQLTWRRIQPSHSCSTSLLHLSSRLLSTVATRLITITSRLTTRSSTSR